MPNKKSDIGLHEKDNYSLYLESIKKMASGIVENYLLIGHYLNKLQENELFKSGGFNSIYDLAKKEFDLSETTIKNSMNVSLKYCDENGNLKAEYVDFKYSALVELLPVSEETVIEDYKPEMTVKEIRQKKKDNKKLVVSEDYDNEAEDLEDESVASITKSNAYDYLELYYLNDIINSNIYNFIALALNSKTSNLCYRIVTKEHLELYLDPIISESNIPFITIKGNELLTINSSDETIQKSLEESLEAFNKLVSVVRISLDLIE